MADKKTKIQNVSDVLKGAATAASAVKAVSGILNKDSNDLVGGAIGTAQGIVGNLNNQIPDLPSVPDVPSLPNVPDVPNPKDVIPDIPKIPKIGGLIGSLPVPQFRKPEPVKVDPPPQPKKLEKQSKIPNVPKESQPTTTYVPPPTLTDGNVSDIPSEFRKVTGGVAFDEATRQGRVFYGRDAGFGQIQVYAVSNSTQKVVGPFRTSGTGVIFS